MVCVSYFSTMLIGCTSSFTLQSLTHSSLRRILETRNLSPVERLWSTRHLREQSQVQTCRKWHEDTYEQQLQLARRPGIWTREQQTKSTLQRKQSSTVIFVGVIVLVEGAVIAHCQCINQHLHSRAPYSAKCKANPGPKQAIQSQMKQNQHKHAL